jgi:hypothetical protein
MGRLLEVRLWEAVLVRLAATPFASHIHRIFTGKQWARQPSAAKPFASYLHRISTGKQWARRPILLIQKATNKRHHPLYDTCTTSACPCMVPDGKPTMLALRVAMRGAVFGVKWGSAIGICQGSVRGKAGICARSHTQQSSKTKL